VAKHRARVDGNEFVPDFGYRRQIAETFGVSPDVVDKLHERLYRWSSEAVRMSSPEVYLERLDRVLTAELAEL
jgi:hypothetical protein